MNLASDFLLPLILVSMQVCLFRFQVSKVEDAELGIARVKVATICVPFRKVLLNFLYTILTFFFLIACCM